MDNNKKYIDTPRGIFRVEREFSNEKEAKDAGYSYYFLNTDGNYIYIRHIDEFHATFGVVPKTNFQW